MLAAPYFLNHEMAVRSVGATAVEAPVPAERGFSPAWTDIAPHVSLHTRAVVLVSPSNPTGAVVERDNLRQIVNECRERDVIVVVDETYLRYVYDTRPATAASLAEWSENVVVVGSFSKAFAITGWRCGYLIAHADAIAEAMKIQEANVGEGTAEYLLSFKTQAEKDAAAQKAFGEITSKYGNTREGLIAKYFLGTIAADQGKAAEAEQNFKYVAENATAPYASQAKFSLAQLYASQGKTADAEKLLRSIMANPTIFRSRPRAFCARSASCPMNAGFFHPTIQFRSASSTLVVSSMSLP